MEPSVAAFTARVAEVRLGRAAHPVRLQRDRHLDHAGRRRATPATGRGTCAAQCASPRAGDALADPDTVLLEVGPGTALQRLARRHPAAGPARVIASCLPDRHGELEALLTAVARLFCAGVEMSWTAFSQQERRRRVPLPTYTFERNPYLLGAQAAPAAVESAPEAPPPGRGFRDAVEETVARIWSEILGVDAVRPEDDFFDLGGDSFMAVYVRKKVDEQLDVLLPAHALLESQTVESLSDSIRRALPQPAASGLLVCLRQGSPPRRPLFLIQPAGGTVYTYRALAPGARFRSAGLRPPRPGPRTGGGILPDVPRAWPLASWRRSGLSSRRVPICWAGTPPAGSSRTRWRSSAWAPGRPWTWSPCSTRPP